MGSNKNIAASATLWSALEITVRYSIQLVVMALLARLLRPEDFGLIAMILVFTALGALFVDAGLGISLIQRQQTSADDETTAFLANLAISAIVALALFFFAPWLATFYQQPALTGLARLMSLIFPLSALATVPDALLTQRMAFKTRTHVELGTSLMSGLLGVGLALAGYGVWSLAWQSVASIGARSLMLWLAAHWRPTGRFRLASLKQLSRFGGYMLAANLLDTLYTRLQLLLIGKLFSSRDLGFYAMAQNTQQVPTTLVAAMLNRVGLPLFSSFSMDRERLVATLRRALHTSMFIFAPVMASLALFSRPLIILVFGRQWESAAPIFSVLMIAGILLPWHVLNLVALNSMGRSDLVLRIELVKKCISVILVLLSSRWGPMAIAWSAVISSLLASFINAHYNNKLLDYGAVKQSRDLLPTIALTALVAVSGYGLLAMLGAGTVSSLAVFVLFFGLYSGIAMVFRHPAVVEIRQMMCAWQR